MSDKIPKTLHFDYKKTNSFRTYHVDGVFGGVSPKGKIFAEFFIEKFPTPTYVEHSTEGGELGKETKKKVNKGITRLIECGIVMDIPMAIAFRDWLDNKIKEFESLKKN